MCCFWRNAKRVTVCIVVLAGCSSAEVATAPAQGPAAEIVIEPATVDLGRVGIGTSKSFRASVRNLSDRSLTFVGFETGCGCSQLTPAQKKLSPHQTVEIRGEFHPPEKQLGPFRRAIKLRWGSAESVPATLMLAGEVVRDVVLTPEVVVLRPDAATGQGGEAAVSVENRSSRPITVRLESLSVGVSCQPDTLALPAGARATLKLRCDPGFLVTHGSTVIASTTHPAEGRVPLDLHIAPVQALQAHPREFQWGVLSRQELLRKAPPKLTLLGPATGLFELDRVETPPYLKLRESKATAGLTLTFDWNPAALTADLNNAVILHLRPKSQKQTVALKIPTSGLLLDP
jgi:hypothetical protein